MSLPRQALERSRTIAVLGARTEERSDAAGYYVPEYLYARGYTILPVNPRHLGAQLWGAPFTVTLAELTTPVDLVDVFRRSADIPAHVPDILAMDPLPTYVWFQLGIRNDAAAAALEAAGIQVVQNRCTLADHRRFGL